MWISDNSQVIWLVDILIIVLKFFMVEDVLKEYGSQLCVDQVIVFVVIGIFILEMKNYLGCDELNFFCVMFNIVVDVWESIIVFCGFGIDVYKSQVSMLFDVVG